MTKPPAFQFYARDWLGSLIQRLSLAAQGAYINLLALMWADGPDQHSITDDDALIARMLRTTVKKWQRLRKEILQGPEPLFEIKDDRLISPRLRLEVEKQHKFRELQSQKGRISAEHRFNRGSTTAQPGLNSLSSLSPSIASSPAEKELREGQSTTKLLVGGNGHPPAFDIFWKAYPKKRGKGQAERVWRRIKPDDVLLGQMLSKLEQAKRTPDWTKEDGQYIPHPASWLSDKGWEDEYKPPRRHVPL